MKKQILIFGLKLQKKIKYITQIEDLLTLKRIKNACILVQSKLFIWLI